MADDNDKSTEDLPEGDGKEPFGGERLAQARRDQRIPISEIAKELHLDEQKVRALERNDFALLGAPVFAKGHLRKYAQIVGVNDDDVFADYYAMTRSEGMPPIVGGRKRVREQVSLKPVIIVVVAVLLAAAVYWWLGARNPFLPSVQAPATPVDDDVLQPAAAQPEPQPQPAQEDPAPADPTPLDDSDVIDAPLDDSAIASATEAVELTEPAAQNAPVAATDQIRLSLSFSGECWTEISDADGRRLFFNMGRDGQTVELNGAPPISALFGNADNVTVEVNNRPYALPRPNNASRTVRVSILDR